MTKFWGIHNDQPDIDPVKDGAVRIGWDEVGDLSVLPATREAFRSAVARKHPERPKSVSAWAGTLYRFVHELAVGDIVVCPDSPSRAISIGRVIGEYEYHADAPVHRQWRGVHWIATKLARSHLSLSAQEELSSATTLFKLTTGKEEVEHLINAPIHTSREADFAWVAFYRELADAAMQYRYNRPELLRKLWNAASASGVEHLFKYLRTETLVDGSRGPISDIDPFTLFSPFNRGIKDDARAAIAAAFRDEFEVNAPAPTSFDGIPRVNNMNSWFIRWEAERAADEVDNLWALAAAGISYAAVQDEQTREALVAAFDAAAKGNTRQLSMGLYWIRPETFAAYDQVNVAYLAAEHPDVAEKLVLSAKISGEEFLANTEFVRAWIESDLECRSVPELSYAAWAYGQETASADASEDASVGVSAGVDEVAADGVIDPTPVTHDIYTIDSIVEDACFVPRGDLEQMRERLLLKKNLIFQGPPGTGKTWLARRIAWTLCNETDSERVLAIQFHPSLTYEDFVRGWRPGPDGLNLIDGPFLEVCERARHDAERPYVLVIEEINRGNPAQIFGELLTLLEADKRNERNAMRLAYPRSSDERFFVPPNVHVIGTMNVADRSLAIVDMALRRRFAFIELTPSFGTAWAQHVSGLGYDLELLEEFGERIRSVNEQIENDHLLGRQFCIGHSYFTPSTPLGKTDLDTRAWLERVVHTEVGPLLEEYWFDDPQKADSAVARLLDR